MKTNSAITTKKIFTASAITASVVVPSAYMTKFHMDLFDKNDKQNRVMMRNKMLGFFAGIGASTILVHKQLKYKVNKMVEKQSVVNVKNVFIKSGLIVLAAMAPFVGLESAKKINKSQYPEKF